MNVDGLAALTPRQRDVAQLLAQGLSRNAIARCLGISPNTVHRHEQLIFTKLNCHCRTQVALLLAQQRLSTPAQANYAK